MATPMEDSGHWNYRNWKPREEMWAVHSRFIEGHQVPDTVLNWEENEGTHALLKELSPARNKTLFFRKINDILSCCHFWNFSNGIFADNDDNDDDFYSKLLFPGKVTLPDHVTESLLESAWQISVGSPPTWVHVTAQGPRFHLSYLPPRHKSLVSLDLLSSLYHSAFSSRALPLLVPPDDRGHRAARGLLENWAPLRADPFDHSVRVVQLPIKETEGSGALV